LDPLNG